ncbi:ribokinase [Paenibacillus eucommiae]|uniref:Ribokinase n=1 Tax=Paenibacillus eucommiae TaxID=1355755 RepID=A0ABS4J706_9BACL|nr:ribokinase [Paenibacillus eucommiae]MBP1995629.1 ribokinase [Paenibacillus eucommiae]
MQPNIVVVGSLNMDLVVTTERIPKIGETLQGDHIHYVPGGKGANQAVGCARLGASVSMIGAVGTDMFARQIMQGLSEANVGTSCIEQMQNVPTGIASILHTKEDNCIVVVPGANGHCTAELVTKFEAEISSAKLLMVQLEIPVETVHFALQLARQHGVTTVLNPAPAKRLPEEMWRLADYLTPNETEFEELSGVSCKTDSELEQAMKQWEKKYEHMLIVTRGKNGCSYLDDSKLCTISTPKVDVVDTTGAGDAFNAALSVGIASGHGLLEAVDFAVKAASLSVTKFGAQSGMPTQQEINSAFQIG